MRYIFVLFLIICLLPLVGCGVDPKLERQVQIEAYEFEKLLKTLATDLYTLKYPETIPLEPCVPRGVRLIYSKNLGKDVVITDKFTRCHWEGNRWMVVYVFLFSSGDPNRVVAMGVEVGYSDSRAPVTILTPVEHTIMTRDQLLSDLGGTQCYNMPKTITHDIGVISAQPPSYGYRSLNEIAGQMFSANPYVEKSYIEQYKTPQLSELVKQLENQTSIVHKDINASVLFINELERNFLKYPWCYNTQNEVSQYKTSMENVRKHLLQVEDDLQKIKNWDFSNLEKYRQKKAKLTK